MARHNDRILNNIVEALKKEFKPSRIFLFGSRAQGTARTDSDYDFVIIVPSTRRSLHSNLTRARELLRKECNVSADVFVYSQKEFDEWKNELSSIPETALNTGREILLG
jgi:predicted nucleotidyltransferase